MWKREPPDADAILERMREDREELALQNLPIHDSDWDPLCPVEIAMRAKFFSGKAAGPDGWSGNEIATMPIAVFVFLPNFVNSVKHLVCSQVPGKSLGRPICLRGRKVFVPMTVPEMFLGSGH